MLVYPLFLFLHVEPSGEAKFQEHLYKKILTYFLAFFPLIVMSQDAAAGFFAMQQLPQDTTGVVAPADEPFIQDGLPADTLVNDTVVPARRTAEKAPVINAPINYSAEDSIVGSFDGQKVYLYNNAKVTYQQIELNAYFIELNLETKEVYAEGITDSTGVLVQKPIFKDGREQFESQTLRYNFETEKGIITEVVTEQGEGFVHSRRTKKISADAFILKDGKYTTCNADHPHYYLHLTKAKVISNNKIITGPAYMVLEDFPLYFPILPFGYFPNSPTYSSGILIPSYGEENNRGFFLRDGGYYWAASEYFDLAVRGDIYSKGSWATNVHTNYRMRYRFSGGFDFRYSMNKYGERGLDTYRRSPQFAITWNHSQDPKANPNRTFSASVNFSTSGFDRQNLVSTERYLSSQKSSSVSYSKKFENTPYNLSLNLRHSQNSLDSSMTLTLPEMTFSMAKIYPLRAKQRSGPLRWYEKFGINYTGNMRNTVTAHEKEILHQSFTRDWKNGIRHNIPITLPGFNLFNHINVTPSFSYNEKWYFKKYDYTYHAEGNFNTPGFPRTIEVDTITGLNRVYDYSYALSASTNIYGMFLPRNPNSKVRGIRHKMTPNLSFSYRPDFGAPRFNYWQPVQVDEAGTIQYFDVNRGGIYGGSPSMGASGSINLNVNNNLEAKVLDTRDTTRTEGGAPQFRKVKIIDNLSFGTSYNLIADSLNLSPVNIRARTTVAGVSINMGAVLDPYETDANGNTIHRYVWNERSGLAKLGRLTRANLSFGMNFRSKQGQRQAERNRELIEEENVLPGSYSQYEDFNIPWDFGFDYSFNYTGPRRPTEQGRFMQTLGFRGNLNLTKNWRLAMNTNYDIMAREFSFTTFNISRDLHCWAMSFNFVPFGYMKSYSFTINAKSSMLQDLRIQKRQSHYDNF